MNESILLINDITCYGKVGSQAMQVILNHHGIHSHVMPSAIVSNTLDYGKAEIFDTTEFMKNSLKLYLEMGISFDYLAIGLVDSPQKVRIIESYIKDLHSKYILLDPIMADDNKLYPQLDKSIVQNYLSLASYSNLIIPNITEAKMMTGLYEDLELINESQLIEIGLTLRAICPGVIITSAMLNNGKSANLVIEDTKSPEIIYYTPIHGKLVGTGDIFSGELISQIIQGSSLFDACICSHETVCQVIKNNNSHDPFNINIECAIRDIYS